MAEKPEPPLVNNWRIDAWFPELGPVVLKQLKLFNDELIKFNKTLELVSPKTLQLADAIHFADGIMASRVIISSNPKIKDIFDLATGNGFPGLVFAILNPQIKVHLVDSDQKKCEFLKHIIAAVKIPNADVLNVRVEDMKENSIQYAMSRGFANISKVILLTRKIVIKGGVVYHLKSEQWGMEVSNIPIQLCSSWAPGLAGEYRLPIGEMKFAVIKTDKIS